MQAQPQSIPAARTSITPFQIMPSTLASSPMSPTTSCPAPPLHHPRVRHLQPTPSPFLPSPPSLDLVSGVAQGTGLAHDAGNLLGALRLYCDLLRAPGVLRQEHLHYATELSLISARSSELIQRLLSAPTPTPLGLDALSLQPSAVRRRDIPPSGMSPLAVSHASVLRDLAPVLERIAAGAATVSVLIPSSLPAHNLPVETLERITVNLVRNAAEAIRSRHAAPAALSVQLPGEIRVILGVVAGRLQLTVEDNGPGIPPAVAAAFLRPAALPPNTRRGLGHRIIHELVTSSQGQLSIRVRPGCGTTFCLKWSLTGSSTQDPGPVRTLPLNESAALGSLDVQQGVGTC